MLPSLLVKLLSFQTKRFRWKTHSKTLAGVPDQDVEEEREEAVVVFVHAEATDGEESRRASILRQSLKHVKWLANKGNLRNVVLHSFTHLGGQTAPPGAAEAFLDALARRLRETGYEVAVTPFGYFCEWDLSVYGESLAKVWKEIH
ncbi:MAG: threonyl-tRNA synthetase editing domain-containing protein [Candidatus Binatia bacterium]